MSESYTDLCVRCLSQLTGVDVLAIQFLSGADKCLGETLFSVLQTVEDCEVKLVDCSEELTAGRQIRSPVKMLMSPLKVAVYCRPVCWSVAFVCLSLGQLVVCKDLYKTAYGKMDSSTEQVSESVIGSRRLQ